MAEDLKLSKPFTALSGETIESLHFNFDAIKTIDYRQIVRLEARLRGNTDVFDVSSITRKTSPEFRMSCAWVAAIRGTKGLCFDDIDNLSLSDLIELEDIGLFFIAKLE